MRKTAMIAIGFVVIAIFLSMTALAAPIPVGWNCSGACGTLGPDGNVPLSPFNNSFYEYVTTSGGAWGAGVLPTGALGSETNGSVLTTPVFSANAGDALNFYFNFVTSDGAGWADYAWAALMDPTTNSVAALLFTARTQPPPGNIVPGFGMPAPTATLNPASVPIQPGTSWSPLDGTSGNCFSSGCGNSGWVQSVFTIPTTGNYDLEFGVTNWGDTAWDSGMAIDGVTVAGNPIPTGATPEPSSLLLLMTGLAGLGAMLRNKFLA
jgi:hypothetical protein